MQAIKSILVLHTRPEEFRDVLQARAGDATVSYATTSDAVLPALQAAQPDAVFSIKHHDFPGHIHRQALVHPSVKWLHVGGSGYEHMLPWPDRKVMVTNCAGVLAPFLAETVIGAMIALNGHLITYRDQQKNRLWRQIPFRPLRGQTLLIVGLGAIGGRVAELAKALGMRVLAIRRSDTPHRAVDELHTPDALANLIGRADVVSLHVRLDDATHHLIDAAMLSAMKPGAMLLSTSRGAVVDQQALITGLKRGHPRVAYLDVFAEEPLPAENELWGLPNVLITPHTADNVTDWTKRFATLFCDNLALWQKGETLLNVVRE